MTRARLRLICEGLALAALYFLIGEFLLSDLPYATPSDWWVASWPSRRMGVITWLQALDVLGAIATAVPVALLVLWRFGRRILVAALIPIPTVVVILLGYPCCSIPGVGWNLAIWITRLIHVAAMVGSVPVMVSIFDRIRLTIGWSDRDR